MINKLKIKVIYDDFISKVNLSEEQIKILNMYINKDTRYKISREIGVSERTVGYELQKIKALYKNYCNLELTKATILKE